MLNLTPSKCASARESLSRRLDGELSELEAARLDDHLRDCAECSAYARELHAIAIELRSAALEQPKIMVFVPARRRPLVRAQTAGAAAAIVAVAAGSSFAIGRVVGVHGWRTATTVTGTAGAGLSVQADSAEQHRLAMVRRPAPGNSLRVGRVIAV